MDLIAFEWVWLGKHSRLIMSCGQDEGYVTVPPTKLEGARAQLTPRSHWPQGCKVSGFSAGDTGRWKMEATGGWKKCLEYIRKWFQSKEKVSWDKPSGSFIFLILQMWKEERDMPKVIYPVSRSTAEAVTQAMNREVTKDSSFQRHVAYIRQFSFCKDSMESSPFHQCWSQFPVTIGT